MNLSGSLVPVSVKISGTAPAPAAAASNDCDRDAAWIYLREECRKGAENSGRGPLAREVRGDPRSSPPTLHELQADLSPYQRGVGGVVAKDAGQRIELVNEGRGLIEEVIHAEIALGIGDPPLPTVAVVAEVQINRRPRIHAPLRHRARILVGAGVVHGRQNRPAFERPGQSAGKTQLQGVADRVHV